MLIDFENDNIKKLIRHEGICIVGSGIGASSLAIELLRANIPFCVVEAGPLNGKQSNIVKREHVGTPFKIRSTTSIEVGGTSSLWQGVLAPLDKIDFEEREWINHSGWAIKYNDLVPFYKKAGKILGLVDYDFFDIKKLPNKLSRLLKDLRFNKKILNNKIFQRPLPVTRFKNKLSTLLENSKTHHIYYNLCALELIQEGPSKIKKLICGTSDGNIVELYANKFVICSGALETPRLLMNSNIKNKNIGKYLMDHPAGAVCQVEFKEKQNSPLYQYVKSHPRSVMKSGLKFNTNIQEIEKIPNHCFYILASLKKWGKNQEEVEKVKLSLLAFRDGRVTIKDIFGLIKNINLIFQIIAFRLAWGTKWSVKYKYADLVFVTEQTPNPNSTVSLSETKDIFGYPIAKINWQIADKDVQSVHKMFEILKDKVFDKKYVEFLCTSDNPKWSEIIHSSAHHLGTARMSDSPDKGVVNKNLKVFGIDNLYICDGSVFPTSGNANSSFTTSALACRLADYLINENR